MNFENYLEKIVTEAFDPRDFNMLPEKKKVSVVIGRFNPWTRGHNSIIDEAKYPVVVGLVKSSKTSLDKERNPFNFETQKEIIRRANEPKIIDVVKFASGNIPQIISDLRDLGYEPKELLAGTDRAKAYQNQIDLYPPKINSDLKLKVLTRNEDDPGVSGISATKVREAIRSGNYINTRNMMMNIDEDFFEQLHREMIFLQK